MDRITGKNTVDIGQGRRGFKDQDAVAGIPGTVVLAKWLNGLQEELLKVIEDAGIAPNSEDWDQLSQALGKMAMPPFSWSINWMAVKSMDTAIPPDAPLVGDVYFIPANASGAWAGKSWQLAIAQQSGWLFAQPKDGHGFALPDGRLFIRQKGEYKELQFDAGAGNLADLKDIDNAKPAAIRNILTKAEKGYTFLTPQNVFEGVKIPVADVKDLDLTKFAYLDKANIFLQNNIFKGELSVNREASFASSVSTVALTAGGTATFSGPLIANGEVKLNKGAELSAIDGQFGYLNFTFDRHEKNAGGLSFSPKSDPSSKVEIAYLANGGLRISTPNAGDILTIDKSGFLTIQGSGIQWGKGADGWPAGTAIDGNIRGKVWSDTFGGSKDNKENGWAARRIFDFINRECVREMKTSGYWDFAGWHTWEASFGARVVTWCKSDQGKGIYGVTGIGLRDLLYRVGGEWRQPWIG